MLKKFQSCNFILIQFQVVHLIHDLTHIIATNTKKVDINSFLTFSSLSSILEEYDEMDNLLVQT